MFSSSFLPQLPHPTSRPPSAAPLRTPPVASRARARATRRARSGAPRQVLRPPQNRPRWSKRAQRRRKIAPGPKTAPEVAKTPHEPSQEAPKKIFKFAYTTFQPLRRSTSSKRPPKPPQDGPKGSPEAPKMAPEGSKTVSEAPKTAQEDPKTAQEIPKRGTTNREFQPSAPRSSQEAPRAHQEAPRGPRRPP